MPKPIDSIHVEILPNVIRLDPTIGDRIEQSILSIVQDGVTIIDDDMGLASRHKLYAYGGNGKTLEITAAERLPIAVIDDQTLLNTLAAAAMERGVPMQQLIRELAKEYR